MVALVNVGHWRLTSDQPTIGIVDIVYKFFFLFLCRSVTPILNNTSLYKMGAGEYLEPGLFNFDPWGFIVYNFPS
jgi:hypothetical protein